jgi:hypothetical protein
MSVYRYRAIVVGDLGRFFETAWCTARPSAPKKIIFFWTTFDSLWYFINDFYFLEFFLKNFFLGCFTRQCGLSQIPNAGHPIWFWFWFWFWIFYLFFIFDVDQILSMESEILWESPKNGWCVVLVHYYNPKLLKIVTNLFSVTTNDQLIGLSRGFFFKSN